MAIGRKDYRERKEKKIDAFNELANKNSTLANMETDRAREMGGVIPPGQPIQIGHHSEKRHRALLKRIEGAFHRAAEADKKAAYYRDRAETAENNQAISGDDTKAVERYKEKLAKLETAQEHMKAVNRAWKQGKEALYALGLTDFDIEKLKAKMPGYETKPYPAWALSNNNAAIRTVKARLEELSRLGITEAETVKFNGGEMRVNTEINRIQFLFDDVPPREVRKLLKSHGFKWSPAEKAWQRQRTLNAVSVSKQLLKEHFNK